MSPYNVKLGDLPSNAPLLTGKIQDKRGVTDTYPNYNNTVPSETILQDGSGGNMSIQFNPLGKACFWLVEAQAIWTCGDPIWARIDWGLKLSPSDADGRYLHRVCMEVHSSVPWTGQVASEMYRLPAVSQLYTCSMVFIMSSGYNQTRSTHPQWNRIMGRVFEDVT